MYGSWWEYRYDIFIFGSMKGRQVIPPPPARVMGCGAAKATGLGFVLLLSTLMCCQPTELIWAYFCHIFSSFTPLRFKPSTSFLLLLMSPSNPSLLAVTTPIFRVILRRMIGLHRDSASSLFMTFVDWLPSLSFMLSHFDWFQFSSVQFILLPFRARKLAVSNLLFRPMLMPSVCWNPGYQKTTDFLEKPLIIHFCILLRPFTLSI